MDDIYGRLAPSFGGAFSADSTVANFAGVSLGGGVGLLTQSINVQYQQNIMRIYDIGSNLQYYVSGRPQGTASLSRVLGPRPILFAFYAIYGNPCNAGTNTITFAFGQGCKSPYDAQAVATSRFVSMIGCVLQSVGLSIQSAEQMLVSEQSQLMFVSLIPQTGVG